jgi:hypothetical protein
MRPILTSRYSIVSDRNHAISKSMQPGRQPCRADSIRNNRYAVFAKTIDPQIKQPPWQVKSIGNHRRLQLPVLRQKPMQNVFVPRQQRGASIPEMCDPSEPMIDRTLQLVETCIGVSSSDPNIAID